MYSVSQLFIYPVKSLAGIALQEATVELRGFQYDRRWMIVDETGRFLTQREHPEMALVGTNVSDEGLSLFKRDQPGNGILVPHFTADMLVPKLKVQVWGDVCAGYALSRDANGWLSERLAKQVQLVYMPDTIKRAADGRYAPKGQYVSYADGYPFLLLGQASLDGLNERLENPVGMDRFRPNIVFEGGQAHDEDTWGDFSIGDVAFRGVKTCGRCVMTTIDQHTGEQGKEPLRTLAAYRMQDKRVLFGQNVVFMGKGMAKVRLNDNIEIA